MTLINDEMRKKQEGLTLAEKIAKSLEKIKLKNVISHIQDAFFVKENEQDSQFWTRRTNLFREEGRTMNVEDEVAIAQKLQRQIDLAEASRDPTYEEFKFKYEDHIEGKAPNLRTARQSNFGDEAKSTRSKSQKGKSKKVISQSGVDDDEDAKSSKSKKADQETADQINKELEALKYELPHACMVSFAKSTRIEKLEAKYLLVAHPYPSFEGEMLLC